MLITVDWLKKHKACEDAVARAKSELNGGLPLDDLIALLDRGDWLIWLLHKSGRVNKRQLVKLACIAARQALRFVPANEDRPRAAIEAAEAWLIRPSAASAARAASAAWAASATSAAWAAEAAGAAEHKAIANAMRREIRKASWKGLA